MPGLLQDGIYYDSNREIGNCHSYVFLKVRRDTRAEKLAEILTGLWIMYKNLKKGVVRDLEVHPTHLHTGNLTVLIGYGPGIFDKALVSGIRRNKPQAFDDKWLFLSPHPDGGGPLLEGSGVQYSNQVRNNPILREHILIQFISETQISAYRPVVETWKFLRNQENLQMTNFYTGFLRPDRRGWLGFHEGISNIKPSERSAAVSVNHFNISQLVDQWTINGTYLAFLRISIYLEEWENLSEDEQSIIIGRDKLTGCPIIGVNGSGKPVIDGKCPAPGTYEIIDPRNEPFREHPPFGRQINLPEGLTDGPLALSHIGRTRHVDNVPSSLNQSSRIFRQGSEFIETTHEYPFFRVGINFVSFQNSIEKLFRILTTPSWLGRSNIGRSVASKIADMNTFQSVLASGLFFVPPINNDEPFPGSSIFR